MKWGIFILFLLASYVTMGQQQKQVHLDTTSQTLRAFPEASLDTYRQNDDFRYTVTEDSGISLWDRFWRWFWRWIDRMFERKGVADGTRIVIYGVSLALVVYAVYKFSGMDRRNLFRASGKDNIIFQESHENIYEMDLPQAIRQAEAEGNYRLALRLQYLKSLRTLADRKLIDYTPHKTNHEYARELTGTPYASSFSRVTLLYEFGWYGEFEITEEIYQRIRAIFDEHFQTLAS